MPSSTLVAAAAAAPPLRRRQRRPFESVTLSLPLLSSLVPPPRDWAGLPPELISCILHRLDHVQIMLGPDKVCRSWRRAARDEPELWRRIDMRGNKALCDHRNLIDLNQMAAEAVRRSQGQCQEFSGEADGLHDEFIHYLGDHAPSLKCLILDSCGELSVQGFLHAIEGFPLLEELHLYMCWDDVQRARAFEVIAMKCPHLKHLTVCNECSYPIAYGDNYTVDKEAMAIADLQELRSLKLTHNYLTDQGLAAILDNCIHLKSLDLLNCYNIHMTPEMEARIKTKNLLMNYSSDGRWDSFEEMGSPISSYDNWDSFDEPGSHTSDCSTCFNYFRRSYQHYPIGEKEAMVISAVRELRSLELYHNDLTSKALTDVLDKCPHLEPLDVWNCLNIVRNNNNELRATPKWHHRIKAKKLTTKLLMRSNPNLFNPECLDISNCCIMAMNRYHRRIIMDSTLGAKYKSFKLWRWAKKHQQRTRKMKAKIERYLEIPPVKKKAPAKDYMEFEGVEVKTSRHYWDDYREFDGLEFEPSSPTSECSTCLMFEYLNGRWGVLDNYSDYYDSSYGLDVYDEIEFQVHDRMVGKRFRRYHKME